MSAKTETLTEQQKAAWIQDAHWVDELPQVKVTRPKGAFCQLDCTALVGLHPAAVFEAMCDTGNQRIYQNAQGVRNRVVIEDTSDRRVVELEMLTSWKFMFLSGDFGVHVRLTQDKPNYKLHFELSKPGFMKKFRGVWSVEPVPVPPSQFKLPQGQGPALSSAALRGGGRFASITASTSLPTPPEPADILELALQAADVEEGKEDGKDDSELLSVHSAGPFHGMATPWSGKGTRLASRVILSQQVQPALNPPPLFSHYLRGIAAKSIIEAMCDIQIEAARLRHAIPETADVHAELRKKGYKPLTVRVPEEAKTEKKDEEKRPAWMRQKGGLRDWSVADGKKAALGRRSKRLSEKEKWKISRSLKDQLRKQCPEVSIAVQ